MSNSTPKLERARDAFQLALRNERDADDIAKKLRAAGRAAEVNLSQRIEETHAAKKHVLEIAADPFSENNAETA